MLINLSNHPTKYWSELQITEAKKTFNSVMDLKFPKIPPQADEQYILDLAEEYFRTCNKLLSNHKTESNAVHIMGEMTFSFALVSLLLKHNITCVAATTDRNTIEENGMKLSEFNFVSFRKYILAN